MAVYQTELELSPSALHEGQIACRDDVQRAVSRARDWLIAEQHPQGYWCGELEGDSILQSETILLLAFLGRQETPLAKKTARYLLTQQQEHGGWSLYPGGPADISASVKAYFALKLTGHDSESACMKLARRAILRLGGADAVNSFTRFYLALLGQISYEHCPAVPPEAMLAPAWFPLSIYRISAWSRTIFVPLSIMWACRPVRKPPQEQGISELFIDPPDQWPELRCVGQTPQSGYFTWDGFFRRADRLLKWCERNRIRPLRRWAIRSAQRWIIKRFDSSDGLGAIFPPIIWSVVALKCLRYDDDHPFLVECLGQLEALAIEEKDDGLAAVRFQPCKSPVWDTALTLRALAAARNSTDENTSYSPVCRAVDWLLDKEVRSLGDWAKTVRAEPGGWFFEHNNAFYPDVDDTIMVMMALREQYAASGGAWFSSSRSGNPTHRSTLRSNLRNPRESVDQLERVAAACGRARQWVKAMQNHDGGWGAFDRNNDAEYLCRVPFADHNAMIDPSTPDLTGRVLEALAKFGARIGDPTVDRAVSYLRDSQEQDGSWPGRWGVNYIYGVWQSLVGLTAVGVKPDDPLVRRGASWLLSTQQSCGGWGETCASYDNPLLKGEGAPTASQTAWALWGLMSATPRESTCELVNGDYNQDYRTEVSLAVRRGVDYLLDTQGEDGRWAETEFTGTGFPRVFYLRYHMYSAYFPLIALAQYAHWRQ